MWSRGFRLLVLILASVFLGYLIGTNCGLPEGETELRPAMSGFAVFNLSIQPEEVQPNETVAITVSVASTHDTWGVYSLVLMIDGVKETEGQAMVAAGSAETVTFCVSREEPGIYSVFINGLSGSFTVVAPREEEVKAEVVVMEMEVIKEVISQGP